jgi:hypothetical protein
MPADPGVNPSLTITAITEHAMSQIALAASAAPNGRSSKGPLKFQPDSEKHRQP